jgi:hypothetical protein
LKSFELGNLGFWRNSYFQIKESKNKRKGKEKRGDPPMIHTKIFGAHKYELGSKYVA